MATKRSLFVITRDKEFIKTLRYILSGLFKIKRITNCLSLSESNLNPNDILMIDISSIEEFSNYFNKIHLFKILVYDRFSPENINEILPHCDFYISKSVPVEDFIDKMRHIENLLQKEVNSITYLPGNTDFENLYLSNKDKDIAVAFIDIDNFRYFYSAKGVNKSETLLRLLSTIIKKNIFASPTRGSATAYNVFMDRFAIISPRDELTRICSFIYEDFSRYKNILFDNSELTRQFFVMQDRTGNIYDIPITTITTVIITRYLHSIIELYKTADDIFRYLKSRGGNLIFSDRRQSISQIPEKGTILIAVYDPMKSNYLKISLERLGWKIFVTNDGITALKLYNRIRPSIIILDEEIPLINYKDIINVLRYELSDNKIAIVLLSEIDELINSQYKFSTLSKDLNAEKINQKFIALLSQNYNDRG
ncbi:MAG: hypothetical protein ACP5QK_08755 [Myxococcota bacterium]